MKSNIAHSVSKNFAILSLQKLVTIASTFFVLLFLPRYLGPVEYGRYYLGLTIVSMFALFIDFGGHYSITKAVSRSREDVGHIISNSIGVRAILWVISFILVILFSILAGYPITLKIIIVVLGIGMIWSSLRTVISSCFQGFEMMEYPSYGIITEAIFVAIIGVPALLLGAGPITFAVITALSWLLNTLVCVKFTGRMTKSFPRINWKSAFEMLKDGLPYFLNSVFGVIYYRISSVMLSLMTPEPVVGWYGAAVRFFDSLMFVPNIFSIALFPALSRIWVEENASMSRRFQRSLDFIFFIGVPISVGAFAYSSELITFFCGTEDYGPSILLMRIFSVGTMLMYIDWILGTMLLASDKQRELPKIAFTMIFVNVALNYFMIPFTQSRFGNGGIGSAIATFITELFVMILMIVVMDKNVFSDARVSNQLKALGAGVAMACSIWLVGQTHIGLIGEAILGSVVYFLVLYYLGAVQKSDLQLIKGMVPKRFGLRRLIEK